MHIPDTREQEINGQENPYFEEYISKKDKDFISGYDWVVNEVIEGFFNNLDIDTIDYANIGLAVNPNTGADIDKFMEDLDTLTVNDVDILDRSALVFAMIKRNLLSYIEMERDELIVSMIEALSEDEYKKNVREVKKKRGEK